MKYKLKPGFEHHEGGKALETGDVVEMDAERAAGLLDRFELVAEKVEAPEDDFDWSEILDSNSADAQVLIGEKVTTVEEAHSFIAAETAGKARKGVLAAAEARLAELEAE